MIRFLILAFLLCSFGNSWGQEHFVTYIDMDHGSEYSSQIITKDDAYILAINHKPDANTQSSSGIIKINSQGEILDELLLQGFSINLKTLTSIKDTIFMCGEYYMGSATAFQVFKIQASNFNLLDQWEFTSSDTSLYNYIVSGSVAFDNKIILGGATFDEDPLPQVSHLVIQNIEGNTLISKTFNYVDRGFTVLTDIDVDKSGNIVIYILSKDFNTGHYYLSIELVNGLGEGNKIANFEIANSSLPRGCVTQDDNILIAVPRNGFSGIKDIWSIDTTGHINWIYEWPSYKGRRNIIRVEQARNGDIFVMGQDWNPELLEDVRDVAFIMRLTPEGKEIWRKYFKIENDFTLLLNYITDVEEMANGDLQLTGQSRRMIFDETIQDYRPDQDIFWARIGGDGCINGDCGDTYLITSTEEIISESAEGIIEIFPNPVTGNSFTVLSKVSGRLYLYDMQGALLHERLITPGEQSCTIKNIPPGTYVAYFTTEDGIGYSQRIVFR